MANDGDIQAFKVVFTEKEGKKKEENGVPESTTESLAQLDLNTNTEEEKKASSVRKKGIKTWYFSIDTTKPKSQTANDWVSGQE